MYLAGQVPEEASLAGDISDQCRSVFAQIEAHLASAGTSVDRILTMTIFLTDIRYISEMNGKLGARFATLPKKRTPHTHPPYTPPPSTAKNPTAVYEAWMPEGAAPARATVSVTALADPRACFSRARRYSPPRRGRPSLPLLTHAPAPTHTHARARLQGGLSRLCAKRRCEKNKLNLSTQTPAARGGCRGAGALAACVRVSGRYR